MTFPLEQSIIQTPTEVPTVDISLWVTNHIKDDREPKGAEYTILVLDQDGDVMKTLRGDLLPHLTTVQKNWLLQFMDDIKVQAEAQILP